MTKTGRDMSAQKPPQERGSIGCKIPRQGCSGTTLSRCNAADKFRRIQSETRGWNRVEHLLCTPTANMPSGFLFFLCANVKPNRYKKF